MATLDLYTDLETFPKRTEGTYDWNDAHGLAQGQGPDDSSAGVELPEGGDSNLRPKKRGNQTGERMEKRKRIRENLQKGGQKGSLDISPTVDEDVRSLVNTTSSDDLSTNL